MILLIHVLLLANQLKQFAISIRTRSTLKRARVPVSNRRNKMLDSISNLVHHLKTLNTLR